MSDEIIHGAELYVGWSLAFDRNWTGYPRWVPTRARRTIPVKVTNVPGVRHSIRGDVGSTALRGAAKVAGVAGAVGLGAVGLGLLSGDDQ